MIHLHLHSEYSFGDGVGHVRNFAERAAQLDQQAFAVTDHGHLYSLTDGLTLPPGSPKYIPGVEIYVIDDLETKNHKSSHLTLIAKTQKGLRKLLALLTRASLEHYYYHPRVPVAELEGLAPDVICLSGCLFGYCAKPLMQWSNSTLSRQRVEHLRGLFPQDFYLELQAHPDPAQKKWNAFLLNLKGPHIGTNDVHYPIREDYKARQVVMGGRASRSEAREEPIRSLWMKSEREMLRDLPDKSLLDRTDEIAEQCHCALVSNGYKVPVDDGALTRLRFLVEKSCPDDDEAERRVRQEMKVIEHHGYAGFFMMVHDIVQWARKHEMIVNNRGSAVASYVLHLLGVTMLDPLKYHLPFTRFMSLERQQPPDIDFDVERSRRDELHQHILKVYGEDHVATLSNIGRYKPRLLINDTLRAYEKGYLPDLVFSHPETLKERLLNVLEEHHSWESQKVEMFRPLFERLYNHARFVSVHAGGMVTSAKPLTYSTHLYRTHSMNVAAVDKYMAEKLGLMKLDVLVVDTLDVIRTAAPKKIDPFTLEPTSPRVYRWLNKHPYDLNGVFQLSEVGRSAVDQIRPQNFEELMAAITVIRPGSSGLETYVAAKKHPRPIHKLFAPYLKRTYGAVLYQEQQMEIFRAVGFSVQDADRMMQLNKKRENQVKFRDEYKHYLRLWIKGCSERGITSEDTYTLWRFMIEYGFNLGHALGYAYLTYLTIWLKAHRYLPFMTALLNYEQGEVKQRKIIRELLRNQIELLPPHVNRSEVEHTVRGEAIQLGLGGIKFVGSAAYTIVEQREKEGRFTSKSWLQFQQGIKRIVNARVVGALSLAGALNGLQGGSGGQGGVLPLPRSKKSNLGVLRPLSEDRRKTR